MNGHTGCGLAGVWRWDGLNEHWADEAQELGLHSTLHCMGRAGAAQGSDARASLEYGGRLEGCCLVRLVQPNLLSQHLQEEQEVQEVQGG